MHYGNGSLLDDAGRPRTLPARRAHRTRSPDRLRHSRSPASPKSDAGYQTARQAILGRFLKASLQGWMYAVTHQPEAVRIVLDGQQPSPAETLRQTRMMSTIARLTESGLQRMGYLEPAAYQRTVDLLLRAPDGPVKKWPAGAWTHAVWDQAGKQPKRPPE